MVALSSVKIVWTCFEPCVAVLPRRVDRGYGPIRRLNVARWAMLAARRQGSKDLLETLGRKDKHTPNPNIQ